MQYCALALIWAQSIEGLQQLWRKVLVVRKYPVFWAWEDEVYALETKKTRLRMQNVPMLHCRCKKNSDCKNIDGRRQI